MTAITKRKFLALLKNASRVTLDTSGNVRILGRNREVALVTGFTSPFEIIDYGKDEKSERGMAGAIDFDPDTFGLLASFPEKIEAGCNATSPMSDTLSVALAYVRCHTKGFKTEVTYLHKKGEPSPSWLVFSEFRVFPHRNAFSDCWIDYNYELKK